MKNDTGNYLLANYFAHLLTCFLQATLYIFVDPLRCFRRDRGEGRGQDPRGLSPVYSYFTE